MSGIDEPGTPPEVPEEYADVYRDAYERALSEQGGFADDWLRDDIAKEPTDRPGWLYPAVVGAAVLLILCAFGLGKLLSSDDDAPKVAEPVATASSGPTPKATPSKKPSPSKKPTRAGRKAWTGAVDQVEVNGVTATCTARPGNDSAGNPVRYDASNAIDGDAATAWRCDGSGIGTVLTLTLPTGTPVGQVGLIPGYAKTDPRSGADRYAENNRITRVRWTLADGSSVVQKLDPSPDNRELQVLRVPRTATGTVTLEVLAVERGSRNTTAISELAVYRAR